MPLLHLFFPLLPIPTHCSPRLPCPTTSFNPWPHHISAQVNAEDGHGAQRQGDVGNDEQQERGDLGDVTGQGVGDGFLQVVKDQAAWEGWSTFCEQHRDIAPPTNQLLGREATQSRVTQSVKGSWAVAAPVLFLNCVTVS